MSLLLCQLCGPGTLIRPEAGGTAGAAPFAHPGANYSSGIGAERAPVTRPGQACRGVYCTLPPHADATPAAEAGTHDDAGGAPVGRSSSPNGKWSMNGHVDGWEGQRWKLSCSTYLQDVGPGGGAFLICA